MMINKSYLFALSLIIFSTNVADELKNESPVSLAAEEQDVDEFEFEVEGQEDDQEEVIEVVEEVEEIPTAESIAQERRVIRSINIVRPKPNIYVTEDVIRNKIPFKVGEVFNPAKTNQVIKNLYDLDYFDQIKITGTPIGENELDLYVIVEEQKELIDVVLIGNKHVTLKEIEDEVKISELRSISNRKLDWLIKKIKNLYIKKDYHLVEIKGFIEEDNGKAIITIDIIENRPVHVKRVFFKGNKQLRDKEIREYLPTKEDWVLSFMNKAGSFQKENLDMDKRIIEQVYKTHGFVNAKVTDVKVDQDPNDKEFLVTFSIDEGDQYRVGTITADGKDILIDEYLVGLATIKEGGIYSFKDMYDSIQAIKDVWGAQGYIFADVQPAVIPDPDTKTVNVHFDTDLGNKVRLRRVSITGNEKTRDYVIRRKLTNLCEGDLITKAKMDYSKDILEGLGYFQLPEGVNWKINRVGDDLADLELIVKEQKTGKASVQLGYGASPGGKSGNASPSGGFSIGGFVQETNLNGWGMTVNTGVNWSKEQWSFNTSFINPYFRQKPIYTEVDSGYTQTDWTQDLRALNPFRERNFNLGGYTGMLVKPFIDTLLRVGLLYNYINYNHKPTVRDGLGTAKETATFQTIVDGLFPEGNMFTLDSTINQNLKNHTMHPTRGYQWSLTSKLGFSEPKSNVNYWRVEGDFSWYTPLIGEKSLVFGFHVHGGRIFTINNGNIPFSEVFHVGGPMTVRGFNYGQISPSIVLGGINNPIGAKKSFIINFEMIFPITPDFSMKGRFFYDGGAGWDAPGLHCVPAKDVQTIIRNNNFQYRHSIGFGLSLLQPQPMKVDFGLKLDKKKGESEYEVHFSAFQEF